MIRMTNCRLKSSQSELNMIHVIVMTNGIKTRVKFIPKKPIEHSNNSIHHVYRLGHSDVAF